VEERDFGIGTGFFRDERRCANAPEYFRGFHRTIDFSWVIFKNLHAVVSVPEAVGGVKAELVYQVTSGKGRGSDVSLTVDEAGADTKEEK
jgi:hypothetical protein